MRSVDTVIIGNGISAKCVIYYLNKIGLTDILQIADESMAPACSTRTTAINCLRGTKRGISPLGDLILDSYADFEDFFYNESPVGIEKCKEVQSWHLDSPKHQMWLRRYKSFDTTNKFNFFKNSFKHEQNFVINDAYVFSPEVFYKWMDKKNTYHFENDFVTDISIEDNDKIIKTKNKFLIKARNIISCTNYLSKNLAELIIDEKQKAILLHSKVVAGTYLRYLKDDFIADEFNFENSFSFAIESKQFIYRKETQDILIGATTNTDSMSYIPDHVGAKEIYDHFTQGLDGVITMPSFEKAQLISGLRHKCTKRVPYWGEINSGIYAVWGLYKNAFSMSFRAGQDIAALISKSE